MIRYDTEIATRKLVDSDTYQFSFIEMGFFRSMFSLERTNIDKKLNYRLETGNVSNVFLCS